VNYYSGLSLIGSIQYLSPLFLVQTLPYYSVPSGTTLGESRLFAQPIPFEGPITKHPASVAPETRHPVVKVKVKAPSH